MLQKDRFLIKAKRFNVNSGTYISYNNSLKKLYDKFNLYDEDYRKLNSDMVEDWLEALKYKKSYRNLIIEHCKEFYSYLVKKHLADYNPFDAINKFGGKEVKKDSKDKYIPSKEEVRALILRSGIREKEPIKTFDFFKARNMCILQLLATQGLRKNIIRVMKMEDIKKNDGYVVVEIDGSRTKAGIPHRIVFAGETMELFNKYLEVRKTYGIDSEYVFTSLNGKKLNASDITDLFDKAVRKANIRVEEGVQFSPHNLRHFVTSRLVANNENVLLIKDILNWGNNEQDMIQRYSNHTEAYDLEKARATSKILD